MGNPFVHLHLHSEYSLLDGISKIRPLLDRIKKYEMSAVALTDHGSLAGAYEFWATCKEYGVKPIIGCEVYVAERTRFDKETGIDDKRSHLTLLAKNKQGYQNLLKLVSLANIEGFYYKPRIDRELITKYSEGIICLSGCLSGKLSQLLLHDKDGEALEWLNFLKMNFQEVYVELTRFDHPEVENAVPKLIKIAKDTSTPLVATCDSHYLDQEDYVIQEIAWCISDGKRLNDPQRRQAPVAEFYVKSSEQMKELFKDIPEAVENTFKIAESVEMYPIEFQRIQPRYDADLDHDQTKELLKAHVMKKISTRYDKVDKSLQDRIDYELKTIDQKGYNDYFLVVEDYIAWAKSRGILVGPGRGSGAGSVVAYILGITNLDPIKWELIFERFLNPERPSPPDFDVDFQDDRRDELFEYMSHKYGESNTSYIGTFGRLKTKAAIRDVARVMGLDLSLADRLSKMVIVKFGKVYPIDKMRKEVPEFDEIIKSSPDLEELAKYVAKLENVARHVSIHACGYLVTPTPITDYVPLQLEARNGNKKITQYEGMHLEPIGLMKFDFLGLTNLTIIDKALKLIKRTRKIEIDIDKIPLDDKLTFDLFRAGNTVGIFQFESDGMQKYLKDLQPTEIEDLIFMNAAYRPGAMAYIPNYIARKKGLEEVDYPHPCLEPVLKSTYGFAIYQEQVINIAVVFAGYSLGEADMLRRAMGKKKKEVMEKEKEKFITKSKAKGYEEETARKIFSYLEPFADYGFNRSHSACYSMIAYQTGYLKANFPLEFLASLMEVDCNTPDKLQRDLKEARHMKIEVLPPNVNYSSVSFTIEEGKKIRFGLSGIKGGSVKSMEHIVDARPETGYRSLQHLIETVGPSNLTKKDLEVLVKVGALDQFGYRNQLLEAIPMVFERVIKLRKNREGGQTDIFGMSLEDKGNVDLKEEPLPKPIKERDIDKLNWEKELLGTFLSRHPLSKYLNLNTPFRLTPLASLANYSDKTPFSALAMITRIKVIRTKKDGKAMAFLSIEDEATRLEGVVFPRDYEKLKNIIKEFTPIIVKGTINYKDGEMSLMLDGVMDPDEYMRKKELEIDICGESDKNLLSQFKALLNKYPGNSRIKIVYGNSSEVKYLIKSVTPSKELLDFIDSYNSKKKSSQ